MVLSGTLVNGLAIVVAGILGTIIGSKLPGRLCDSVVKGMALCVIYIGISGALKGENPLITMISVAVGALIGELIDLDRLLCRLGDFMQKKLSKKSAGSFTEGFVSLTLLTCVGAWGITGALDSGLRNDHSSLYAKAVVDGVSTLIMAAALGIGTAFSALPLVIYQGGIALLATVISPYLTQSMINELTCVGSLLTVGMGLNMLNITKLKTSNMMPAVLMPLLLCRFL